MTLCWWRLAKRVKRLWRWRAAGSEGWGCFREGGGAGDGGQKGTLCPGNDWRMWPRRRAARERGLSGGIRGDRIEMSWSGTLSQTDSHTHTQTDTHSDTYSSPAWHYARSFCGGKALKPHTPTHPRWGAWSPSNHQQQQLLRVWSLIRSLKANNVEDKPSFFSSWCWKTYNEGL